MSFWKKGSDNLIDGTVLGAAFGCAIIWGPKILAFITEYIPPTWDWLDTIQTGITAKVLIIAGGAVIGYILDKV